MSDPKGMKAVLVALIRETFPDLIYAGLWDYTVVSQSGDKISARPRDESVGLPAIVDVQMHPSICGARATLKPGTLVIVGFRNMKASGAFIAFSDPDSDPMTVQIPADTTVTIAGGTLPAARAGDLAGGIWPIAPTQAKTLV